jgi:hypothetical protein
MCLGVGLGVQLLVEEEAQVSIHLRGSAEIAALRQRCHQRTLGPLIEGVYRDRLPEVNHGFGRVLSCQRQQRREIRFFALLPPRGDPLRAPSLQQGTAIERDRFFQRRDAAALEGGIEGYDVAHRACEIEGEGV